MIKTHYEPPAGPLRCGFQTLQFTGLAVWPLFLKALSANRSPSKLQGTFNNVFHSLFMELCSKFIVVKMCEQNKTLKAQRSML